jgi:hypothetical protein
VWRNRPEHRIGVLMILLGFGWFLDAADAANARRGARRRGGPSTAPQPARRARGDRHIGRSGYPTALKRGWPIATGVIEGACRHLVKDRMDLTGARWGLDGAEAILKLHAISATGDFDEYWRFHLAQEHQRVHRCRYAAGTIPPTT